VKREQLAIKAEQLGATTVPQRAGISFTFSALAGAFLVGVAGAKWITNEVDKKLLKESVKIAGTKKLTDEECQKLVEGPALRVLERVERAEMRALDDKLDAFAALLKQQQARLNDSATEQ
jgi:hypothetical protein